MTNDYTRYYKDSKTFYALALDEDYTANYLDSLTNDGLFYYSNYNGIGSNGSLEWLDELDTEERDTFFKAYKGDLPKETDIEDLLNWLDWSTLTAVVNKLRHVWTYVIDGVNPEEQTLVVIPKSRITYFSNVYSTPERFGLLIESILTYGLTTIKLCDSEGNVKNNSILVGYINGVDNGDVNEVKLMDMYMKNKFQAEPVAPINGRLS